VGTLNFVSKFDANLPVDGSAAHSNAHAHVETVSPQAVHAPSDAIIVPDTQLLFNGDFKRSGVDLILSKDDHELVLHDYFKGEKRAALSSPDGAHLTGDLVNALTGHVDYAQADGSASAGHVIGHVTKLTGTATAIRNGVSIILNNGDNVEKGDVASIGSSTPDTTQQTYNHQGDTTNDTNTTGVTVVIKAAAASGGGGVVDPFGHVSGPPTVASFGGIMTELVAKTGDITDKDATSAPIFFADINVGDRPSVTIDPVVAARGPINWQAVWDGLLPESGFEILFGAIARSEKYRNFPFARCNDKYLVI
jgi:hypothetical protein